MADLKVEIDPRIVEINYGNCEGTTISEAKLRYPELFEAWSVGQDPAFPNGESTRCVLDRVESFVEQQWAPKQSASVVCTHNVVLRCLIGRTLGIPQSDWHRIRIPYLSPIQFVSTKRFGIHVNLTPSLELELFRDFQWKEELALCKS